ncbi:tetratricopeptide repeat protein [bacterium]|nr:tetratricopeptide repeat protein [bacterium]
MSNRIFIYLTIIATLVLNSCAIKTDLTQARMYEQQGDYEKARAYYRTHMERRLRDKKRPAEENPYYYLITIGDLYRKEKQYERALGSYDEARANQVPAEPLIFRYRDIASDMQQEGKYDEAIDLLTIYHDLDPLLFDVDIDRVHKAMLAAEDRNKSIAK